ncbi:MAG: hypothetical protein HYY31_06830 [Chloroflexi bacterium]|nr:hypothetical protein [Chloroflexota bacterium]
MPKYMGTPSRIKGPAGQTVTVYFYPDGSIVFRLVDAGKMALGSLYPEGASGATTIKLIAV